MSCTLIGTWRMAFEAIQENIELLEKPNNNGDAIVNAISLIEDNEYFKSVGFGGLPNENCVIELDAAFMNGQTLEIGALAGVQNIKNPIKVARKLSFEKFNCFRISEGAEQFARENGFELKNMLSERAIKHYNKKIKLLKENESLSPYDGHDTVGMVSFDCEENIFAGTSTSGLFMKKRGRVGDSPLPGSGFYAEKGVGGATATGLGEDIFKGCLSYEVVNELRNGGNVKEITQRVVKNFHNKLSERFGKCGPISIIALDSKGNWGIGTNCEFSFAVGHSRKDVKIYLAKPSIDLVKLEIEEPGEDWLKKYDESRRGPII